MIACGRWCQEAGCLRRSTCEQPATCAQPGSLLTASCESDLCSLHLCRLPSAAAGPEADRRGRRAADHEDAALRAGPRWGSHRRNGGGGGKAGRGRWDGSAGALALHFPERARLGGDLAAWSNFVWTYTGALPNAPNAIDAPLTLAVERLTSPPPLTASSASAVPPPPPCWASSRPPPSLPPNPHVAPALPAGLVNGERHDFVSRVVERVQSQLVAALEGGDRDRARMLLRFLTAMSVVNVVQPAGVVALMQALVATALAAANQGAGGRACGGGVRGCFAWGACNAGEGVGAL